MNNERQQAPTEQKAGVKHTGPAVGARAMQGCGSNGSGLATSGGQAAAGDSHGADQREGCAPAVAATAAPAPPSCDDGQAVIMATAPASTTCRVPCTALYCIVLHVRCTSTGRERSKHVCTCREYPF
jgi:hypothetical protein